ncbi:hypothetical protein ACFWFJ_30455, partial [Nocardia salmonicida]
GVVIIGAGAIGSLVLAGLRHLGEFDITAIDIPGSRFDRAQPLGADRTLTLSESIATDALDGRKPDVVDALWPTTRPVSLICS